MNYFTAYLFTRLNSINNLTEVLLIMGIISIVIGLVASACYSIEYDFPKKLWKESISKIKYWAIFLLLINLLVPTQKEASFIYIAPAIVNNKDFKETIQQIPELSNRGLQYLNDLLKEQVKETSQGEAK